MAKAKNTRGYIFCFFSCHVYEIFSICKVCVLSNFMNHTLLLSVAGAGHDTGWKLPFTVSLYTYTQATVVEARLALRPEV